MGRSIDRIIITTVTAAILYLVFAGLTGSILSAVMMTFAVMVIIRKLYSRIPPRPFSQKRRALREAETTLEQLALTDEASAREFLCSLGMSTNIRTEYVLRHPVATLTAADIASIWQKNHGIEKITVISLPYADLNAISLASRLKSPEIMITDGRALAHIIAAGNTIITPDSTYIKEYIPERRHVRMLRAASKARTGKCTLTGLFMATIYFITGVSPYLFGSLILLFIAGISFKHRHAGIFGQ